ncbi:MAG: response regulator, partial [Ktedonobacterales bacterium]
YIAPAVPSAVRGDPSRLRQILLNLVGNAVKFTARGDVVVRVALTEPDEQTGRAAVRFTVSDTGIGLSENARQRLFQPFTQADGSTTRQYGGTGLGLSICRRLVELMGGDIEVESAEGQGSSFWFNIPFEPAQTVPSVPAHPIVALQRLAGRRVLAIDDNRAHRAILQNYFNAWGLRGAEAADAAAGLATLREAASQGAPFDAAVVDYMMPGMDGMATAHAILADPAIRSTSLVLLTAFDEVGLGQQALQAGFSAYLTKPVKQLSLVDALARALDALTPEELAARRMRGQPKPATTAAVATDASKPRQRLLLAEDNAVNQKLALLQLERLGYQVDVAGNGRQALTMLSQRRYALVLMDCHMPEMDGYEATVAIRASEAPTGTRLPIIAMTANALQGDQERCIAAGMDDYLSKPVTLDGLRKKLDQWMPTEEIANEPAILRGYGAHERRDEATPSSPAPTDGKLSPTQATHSVARVENVDDTRIARPLPQPTDAGVPGAAHTSSEAALAAPFRILLVDDNTVNLKLTSLQLRRLGCAVDVAANGREALEMLARHQYALVLMDCNMPVMDWYEATRAIRSNEAATGSHLPVIAVTANALSGDREVCIEAGMDDYLPKPVKLHALKSLIEQWAPYGKDQRADEAAAAPSDTATSPAMTSPAMTSPATTTPFAITPIAMLAPRTDQAVPAVRQVVSSEDQGEAVDLEQLDAIRALQEPGAPDVVAMVVDEFRVESRELLRTMARAQTGGDAKELHRAAHSLKSSGAYLGARRLSSICADLESLAKTGMTPGAATQRYVTQAEAEYERVVATLSSVSAAPEGGDERAIAFAG